MNNQKTYFTRNGLVRINEEITFLQKEIKVCNIKIGKTVELDNDLRENPEFMALRTKAEYELPNKIQKLVSLLDQHEVIEDMEHIRKNLCIHVAVGHQVTLVDEDGNIRALHLLGYGDSEPKENKLSYLTPLAQKLIDHEVGDEVILPSSQGSRIYEIDAIIISPMLDC
ncbi:GreA/GreB family elongation factor [Klebsiella quasipneumoniae]|uniref:GreA/GreB family elongation factor n=1 Tax=Klebsiella quasipneumoniae TaxID=1463165 RepID=UPI0022878E3D|nr:GreA/GreB family elongation factor [Klebsiella quasipneumoniae]HAS1951404.1 hypothetical protein [Enterobacter asburiae]HCW3121155.1 GreA/GreB family elongation factor [Enterobacter roggenkampii]MDV0854991.1 GreA/GreB family elongation factor [Klebsiella quasipneumoniae subsp. similipneumoniae]MDV0888240.1 GreA/GreB family elongation factor [Klebsiella quasipneumoniae subsp. similipneumoniae]HAS1956215.1 hypothetical protein [Enterobacter asburiae]